MKQCTNCNRTWNLEINRCLFCKIELIDFKPTKFKVKNATTVNIPSKKNSISPYHILLLEDEEKNKIFKKTYEKHSLNEEISIDQKTSRKLSIGIIGTGVTASGIAEVTLKAGHRVTVKSRSQDSLKSLNTYLLRRLSKNFNQDEVSLFMRNLRETISLEDLKNCDIIIECVIEDLQVKKEIFAQLDHLCNEGTIFATNTSSLIIENISKELSHKIIGIHFFNPVSSMKLIEIIGKSDIATEYARSLNKIVVSSTDSPGFIVNRLLFLHINEACKMLEEEVSSVKEIDTAMKLGANYPMGPFQLADFIGLDLCVEILSNIYTKLQRECFKPHHILVEKVNQKLLGQKTKEGFYKY